MNRKLWLLFKAVVKQCEQFIPGEEHGQPFRVTILVCVNAATRSFEQCERGEAESVLEALKAQISQLGLSRQIFVTTAGCLLGCSASGTTVLIVDAVGRPQWYKGVTKELLPSLLKQITESLGL